MKTSRRAMVKTICAGALGLAAGSWAQAAEPGPVKGPFRLIFAAYDGDTAGDPAKMAFQINTVDLRQPTKFLQLGQTIPNTPFKLIWFTFIENNGPSFGSPEDVSEVTLVHKDTGQAVVLVLGKVTNVADLLQPPPKAPK